MASIQRFNKATAAAAVLILAWLLSLAGIEVPNEVQGAITVLLVWAVPNVQ